jgi:hypothetical protein
MNIYPNIENLPSSIYEATTSTFDEDLEANITVDIDMSKITKLSGCVPKNPFTVYTVV